jgi:hypothetical protein
MVRRDGANATAVGIVSVCRDHLGEFRVPRRVLTGKILKRELREHLSETTA